MNVLNYDIRISTEERVLVDIRNFQIPLNRLTFLFGESGIGKSLIARAIYGLLDPEEFSVTINGEDYDTYLRRPGTGEIKENSFFVFQEPSSHLNPLLPLGIQLREGSLSKDSDDSKLLMELWAGSKVEVIEKILDVYPKPYRPSGGEKQRMFLVMALKKFDITLHARSGNGQSLFIFDEPTGSLDNQFRNIFLSLLFKRFQQNHFTTLVITHDYSMVSEVTGSYRLLSNYVTFKELGLQKEKLVMKDFQPEIYLRWLEKQRTGPLARPTAGQNQPLLRVETGAEVFGRRLVISKDHAGTDMCPLEIFPGTIVYLKAPSGTGKTTLVKMAMGLIRSNRLRISLDGRLLTERTPRSFWQKYVWGKKMTMVFQHADEALNPRSTVAETFMGLPSKKRVTLDSIRRTLRELFEDEIGIDFLNKQVSTLSGGQKQRLNLLRSLFLDTDIVILDEPLNGLDFESTTKVLAMLREKQQAGKGILLISHNEEIFETLIPGENTYYLRAEPDSKSKKR